LDGYVTVGDGGRQLGELQASHGSRGIAWQVADDGSCVHALINLHLFNWFLWNNALAYAATLGINHSWDVIFTAGFLASDG
jgi:hypothetical protein